MINRPIYKLTILVFAALPVWLSAEVDPAANADTIHIPEVEIIHNVKISPMISAGTDTITIALTSGRSLSELLAFQPAIYIKSAGRGALSTASLRGTDASHTKVYWNGIRLNSPMLGQVDFSLLPVVMADEISLLYGGSSLKEGSGALGGAVLLENSPDWESPMKITLNQELGSFGTYSTHSRFGMGNKRIRSETRAYWNRSENNYTFLNTDVLPQEEQQLENAAYSRTGVSHELYFRPGERQEVSLRLWFQKASRELPPLMSQEGPSREEEQDDENLRTSMEWKMYPRYGTLSFKSGYSAGKMHYYLHQNAIDYRQFDSRSRERGLYNSLKAEFPVKEKTRMHFRADLNHENAGIEDVVRGEGYEHLRTEASLMGSVYRKLGSSWMLYAMVRQDRSDGNWLPVMPSAGLHYHVPGNTAFQLKGNLTRNYNLPSLNDLYWIPGGNPDLKPENSVNGDISLDLTRKEDRYSVRAKLNLFASRVEDWILWKPTQYRYWEAENIASVFSRGVDIQLGSDVFIGEWRLNMNAGYAYTRSTNEESGNANDRSRGKQLIYIPVHASNAYVNITRSGWSLNWSLSHTGMRYTQPSNDSNDFYESLNPFIINDIHAGKKWEVWRGQAGFRFSVYNLFNVSYQAVRSRPMPMRNFALTLSIEI